MPTPFDALFGLLLIGIVLGVMFSRSRRNR